LQACLWFPQGNYSGILLSDITGMN